jgi:hypothetical protein
MDDGHKPLALNPDFFGHGFGVDAHQPTTIPSVTLDRTNPGWCFDLLTPLEKLWFWFKR